VTLSDVFDPTVPPSGAGCAECLSTPDGCWYHLRRCAKCGHIGCCDTSPSQHASRHVVESGHPIVRSFEPEEDWFYDYRVDDYADGPELVAPAHHPLDQPIPAPADRIPEDWEDHLH